ncbi:hypothetical protein LAD12857_28880 [Lacrimispora amygdalina]|uniref:Bro-N domain-containing protein n=1 Tax=Lacrimispora amygdalina TaxID=253257 RepID=A0ABQ5M8X9_9FIRM
MKTEIWNGYPIRFVEKYGEWWAIAKDVAVALGYAETRNMTKLVSKKYLMSSVLDGMNAKSTLICEFGIYKAIFGSHKPEAEDFQEWVFNVLKSLRQSTGLEGFQIFRMLDKDHQKEAMAKLKKGLKEPGRPDFIKANTIANKAVSTKYGYPKMVKKRDMTPEMLVDRQDLLDSTVELMGIKEKFSLDLSVSDEVYKLASEQKTDQTA